MNKTLTILVCIMVAGVVVGASLPIFDSLTASSESVHNEGAGWVRFALDRNADTTYSLSYTEDENGFYIDNGTDRQTYDDSSTSNFETILYADSNLSVWHDGTMHILGTNEGNPFYLEGSGALTIVRDAEGVTVTPVGLDPVSFGVPTWSYIPVSTGNYGFFLAADFDSELGNGVKNYPSDMPLAVVGGGFAGVYAYNDIYRYNGLGLNMHPVYDEEGLFYGAYWDKTAPVDPQSLNPDVLDPSIIDLDPIDIDLDPIVINPGAQLMAVPTPTYTDGDWGYDIIQVDGVDKAVIVSYSGTGGGTLTIPATIGGYDVYRVGKDAVTNSSPQNNVFNNSTMTSGTSIVISNGIKEIGGRAFAQMNKFGGSFIIPDSVESIGYMAFYSSSNIASIEIGAGVNYIAGRTAGGVGVFTNMSNLTAINVSENNTSYSSIGGILFNKAQTVLITCPQSVINVSIPNTVTEIGPRAFDTCRYTGSLVIPDSVTTIGQGAFYGSKFTGSLVIPDSVTTIDVGVFSNCINFTSLKIGAGLTTLPYNTFSTCHIPGVLTIPSNITTIDGGAFKGNYFDTIVIPSTVTSIGGGDFTNETFSSNSYLKNVVFSSEAIPKSSDFGSCANCEYVLDLSDTVDFTQNRYGLPATITVSDSIGECFGFVSLVELPGSGGSPTQTLIGMLPLIMVLGLVLMAVGLFIWNRM